MQIKLPIALRAIALIGWVSCAVMLLPGDLFAQDAASPADELSGRQRTLTEAYELLEKRLFQLHEYERATNPDRSRLLKQAYDTSQGELTVRNLQQSVEALSEEDWKAAIERQERTLEDLQKLLVLLESEDRSKRIRDEQDRIRQYIAEVDRIMRMQRGIRGQTEGGVDPKRLAKSQRKATDRTRQLGKQIKQDSAPEEETDPSNNADSEEADSKTEKDADSEDQSQQGEPKKDSDGQKSSGEENSDEENSSEDKPDSDESDSGESEKGKPKKGKPSEGKPSEGKSSEGKSSEGKPGNDGTGKPGDSQPAPSQQQDPVQQRIENAERKMQEAQAELEKARREESTQAMEQAEQELAEAKKELEEILRQLREEEVERSLTKLESRFRRMLEQQIRILEKTKLFDKTPMNDRDSEFQIKTGKLSIEQQSVTADADRALLMLREDGSSIAFPETVMQMRDDMQQVATRLNSGRTAEITQELQADIIETLNDLVAALAQAQKEQQEEKQEQQPGQQPQQQAGERPLVDQIAELKMIRGLQMRINKRHKRYAKLVQQPDDPIGFSADPEIREALQRLSGRQEKVQRITRDIVLGKNK